MEEKDFEYNFNMDVKFGFQELIDIQSVVDSNTEQWFNQTLTQVNDAVVRIGIVEGEFHWHTHDNDDEFFYVISGRLEIELEDRTVILNPNQGITIQRGVMHFPKAPIKTVMLMVETATIGPAGEDYQN
jgi:mannose-6-phosphate isomerase-like protein (cupin superfamily)